MLGTLKCGKIWLCPVCSAKIRNSRAEEVTKAAVEGMRRGLTAYLVTFTARHAASHQLADLMDAIQGTRADASKGIKRKPGAYQRLISGAAWVGDKRRKDNEEGIKGRVGFLGMIRATEITLGSGKGWHPHIHAIVFVGAETTGTGADRELTGSFTPSESALAELQDHFRSVWTRHLAAVDPGFKPSDTHGVDFKRLHTEQDAENFGEYIAKLQDGKSPAQELTRADRKLGRGGNMTPFQMLGRIGDLMGGVAEEDADGHGSLDWCRSRWAEYETATKGRRAIEWTRYLRPMLGIEGDDTEKGDLEKLDETDAASKIVSGVQIETGAWHKTANNGLDLAVKQEVRFGRYEDVTALVVASGARAGAVRPLAAAEIETVWQNVLAKLAERRQAAAVRRQITRAGLEGGTPDQPSR
jgi:hypothetical protein